MGQEGCSTFCHPSNFGALFSGGDSSMQGTSVTVVAVETLGFSSSSSFSRRAIPQKISSLVNDRYHFTSSLSSCTLFTNRHGSPPAGRLFCSAQYWRALVYATTFSRGISHMSLQAKMESAGSMNLFQHRHGGAGGHGG